MDGSGREIRQRAQLLGGLEDYFQDIQGVPAGAWGVRINIRRYCVKKALTLIATLDAKTAYADADYVVIAAHTNVDLKLSVAA